jgi:hypothetical protein
MELKMKSSLLFLIFLLGCTAGGIEKNFPRPLPFTTVRNGTFSQFREPGLYRIRSSKEFESLWNRVFSRTQPDPAYPSINFETHEILGVFLGRRNTGGYSIKILKIIEYTDHVKVLVRKTEPDKGQMVIQVLTSPFHLVKIPAVSPSKPFIQTQKEAIYE